MLELARITSATNPTIKEVKSLSSKKGRTKAKAFLLEGIRLVFDAVHNHAKIRYFLISDSFVQKEEYQFVQKNKTKVIQIPDKLFDQISETKSPQGIIAVADFFEYDEHYILNNSNNIIALENLQDPGNLGTIIRSADACGFDAVILSEDSVDIYNPKVIRSTMGSVFHLPVITVGNFFGALQMIKQRGNLLIAAHTKNARPCWEVDLSRKVTIIIGNEGNGLSKEALYIADETIMIPMNERAESLNASTAASILMYESMRQKNNIFC